MNTNQKSQRPLAKSILTSNTSEVERSNSYFSSIQRNLQESYLNRLKREKDTLSDTLFSLKDFTLQTNINKGQSAISREDAEKRFEKILELEYEIELLTLEITKKTEIFLKYFGDV